MAKKSSKRAAQAPVQAAQPIRFALWERHPVLLSLALLLVLLLIQFAPVMLGGKTFLPADAVTSKCYVPFVDDALSRHIYPLWNPYIFGGMPSFASLSRAPYVEFFGATVHGVIWLVGKMIPLSPFTYIFINYFLLGGLAFYLLRSKGLSAGSSLFASVALVFIPQIVAYSAFSHNTKLSTAALIPLIFLLAERVLNRRRIVDFALLGMVMGIQFLRAHVQICFYTQMMIWLYWGYWLVLGIKDKEPGKKLLGSTGLLAGAVVAGVLISSVMYLSVWEYAHYSIRGGADSGLSYGYATDWSFPPSEILTFFIPSFMGFGGQTYWGPMPFTDFPIYLGMVTLCLAGLALVLRRNRTTLFFGGLFGVSLIVSFGKHLPLLYGPMFKLLPFFNKFRAPNMINILMAVALAVLAAYGLEAIVSLAKNPDARQKKALTRYLQVFGGVLLALFLVLLLGRSAYLGWAVKAGQYAAAAYDMAVSDGLRSLGLFIGIAALTALALKRPRMVGIIPAAFIALVLLDLWPVNHRFVEPRTPQEESGYFAETPEVAFLKAQPGPFRIMPINDSRTPNWYMHHFIQSVSGYHPAKLKRVQALNEALLWGNGFPKAYLEQRGEQVGVRDPSSVTGKERRAHEAFFTLMDVQYVLSPFDLTSLDTGLVTVFPPASRGANGVFKVKQHLSRVWFPREARVVESDQAALAALAGGEVDPAVTALVTAPLPSAIQPDGRNTAEVTAYDIQKIRVKAHVETAGLLVFSEVDYPAGWQARVDGRPTEILKADYLLRSVWLEPGDHEIEMVFRPQRFRQGLWISLITFLGLAAAAVIAWQRGRRPAGAGDCP